MDSGGCRGDSQGGTEWQSGGVVDSESGGVAERQCGGTAAIPASILLPPVLLLASFPGMQWMHLRCTAAFIGHGLQSSEGRVLAATPMQLSVQLA